MVAGCLSGLRCGTDSALCRFTCIEDLESSLSTTYAAARASPLPGVIALIHIAANHHLAFTIKKKSNSPIRAPRPTFVNRCIADRFAVLRSFLMAPDYSGHSRPLV